MVEHLLCGLHAAALVSVDGCKFSRRVRAQILAPAQSAGPLENLFSSFNVFPYRLTLAVLFRIRSALKYPVFPGPLLHLFIEISGPLDTPRFPGLGFPDRLAAFQFSRSQFQHIRNA